MGRSRRAPRWLRLRTGIELRRAISFRGMRARSARRAGSGSAPSPGKARDVTLAIKSMYIAIALILKPCSDFNRRCFLRFSKVF